MAKSRKAVAQPTPPSPSPTGHAQPSQQGQTAAVAVAVASATLAGQPGAVAVASSSSTTQPVALAVGMTSGLSIHSPTPFKQKQINGNTYDLDHLCSFEFDISTSKGTKRVYVEFSCHCFTEDITPAHSPGVHYTHKGEKRAFCVNRHALSQNLRNMIISLGTRSVHHTKKGTFFLLKNGLTGTGGPPYLVFFSTMRSKKKGVDVLINVESAYPKPNMTQRASPVTFTKLIEATSMGQKVPLGPEQTIKRK